MDTSIHPLVSAYLLELFNDTGKNPNNGQLIAATHDVSLLDPKILRRDQIWFTAKNSCEATEIFSLDEFDKNEIRKNTLFDKWYLTGRFGALPLINKKRLNIDKKRNNQKLSEVKLIISTAVIYTARVTSITKRTISLVRTTINVNSTAPVGVL